MDDARRSGRRLLATFALLAPVLAAGAMAGCGGSFNGDDGAPLPAREDASGDAPADGRSANDSGVDASPDVVDASVPACDLTKPFDAPTVITELNSAAEDSVSGVSPDELTIYVSTNYQLTGEHSFYATRPSKTATWGALQPLFPNGNFDDWSASVTTDGLTAVVSSDRNGNNSELYVATRGSALAAFGPLGLIAGATNSSANEEGPHWSADGKTLYFDSTRGGSRDLYRASVVGATFGAPQAITELNSGALDAVPVVSADELTVYFLSGRAPTSDGDIYVATRASKALPFGPPKVLGNVNSPQLDVPGFLTADGCTLYMTSTRLGSADIYVARRPK